MSNNKLESFVVPEVEALGFECVKFEVVGSSRSPIIRLFIDKPDGVSIRDCTRVSRAIGLLLEEEDPFTGRYLLEVSSPGSQRPLVTEQHFVRFAGEPAKVVVGEPDDRTTYTGRIGSCINGVLTLNTDDGPVEIALDRIYKAHLTEQEYKIDKKMDRNRRKKRRGSDQA